MVRSLCLLALLPLVHAACVTDESLSGSYQFPLLELDAKVTQPANFLNHQHGVATVHRTDATENCPEGKSHLRLHVCSKYKQSLPSLLAGEGWRTHSCIDTQVIPTMKACQVHHSTEPCVTNTVPLPTASQAAYQRHEIAGLTHFNMATYVTDGDPACQPNNWNTGVGSSNPDLFNPEQLNVSNWIESYKAVGAKHAILTAKHGCGFLLWNTSTTLPNGTAYPYAVMRSDRPSFQRDVIAEFSKLTTEAGLGHGFYYSTGNNYFLNREQFKKIGTPLPGQVDVSDEDFNNLVFSQTAELWTKFGPLFEIWFDHGVSAAQDDRLKALLQQYQPNATGFNGQGIMPSPIKWVGTESGLASYPVWATGCSSQGDPTATDYCPTGGDTYLQVHHWFWHQGYPIRQPSDMIDTYHHTVGNNCLLELDFAIDDTGNVAPTHAAAYKGLGDWSRACYDTPVASADVGASSNVYNMSFTQTQVDRFILQEIVEQGERVRAWSLDLQTSDGVWHPFGNGTVIGHKQIVLGTSLSAVGASLTISSSVAAPAMEAFQVFSPCPTSY
eukprot:m.25937 g.25937  ORF g.25937 m.25937 type:complete len:555 (+) comp11647_c0_seq1:3-1667(+)